MKANIFFANLQKCLKVTELKFLVFFGFTHYTSTIRGVKTFDSKFKIYEYIKNCLSSTIRGVKNVVFKIQKIY